MRKYPSYILSLALNVHPDASMPHVTYEDCENLSELISVCKHMYEERGSHLKID